MAGLNPDVPQAATKGVHGGGHGGAPTLPYRLTNVVSHFSVRL